MGTSSLPTAAALAALTDGEIVALALRAVTLTPIQLSRALGLSLVAVRHARRAPTTLPRGARLTLATLAGVQQPLAPLARELRRRTLTAHRPSPKETRP